MSNILVIEDDPATLYSIVDLLEAEKFQVSAATDGDIALKIIEHKKIDLIVCDLLLPNINGYEVLSALRKNTHTADIPFIVLTGKGKREDICLGKEVGVDDYIVKPFINRELIQSIQIQLDKKIFLEKCYQANYQQTSKSKNKSERDLLQQNITDFLYCDRDTNLPNQLALRDKFNKIVRKYVDARINLDSPIKRKATSVAVCCLNLDGFAELSNRLSLEQNHSAIQIVVQRLTNTVGDKAKIVRLHSGDFALIFPYVKHLNQTIELVQNARVSLSKPLVLEDISIYITPYVGISFYPAHSEDIENLIDHAQKALQQAKQNSEDCYEIYHPNIEPPLKFRSIILLDNLYNAIKNNELSVHYQPQVDLVSGKVVGCEALLRWNHPQRGNISPATFIPIAEDSGFIESIEQWFVRTVLRQLAQWHQQGHRQLKLAINISSNQFERHNFTSTIVNALDRVGLAPEFLTIEAKESILLHDKKNSIEKLSELKSFGVNIAIDNFGTGYSSLSYLEQFPFNVLKVDISHLHNLFGVEDSQIALLYIIKVAQRLNVKVIIEKIETQAQLNFLRQNKFQIGQGYFLSLPLTINKFDLLLRGKPDRLSTLFSFPPI